MYNDLFEKMEKEYQTFENLTDEETNSEPVRLNLSNVLSFQTLAFTKNIFNSSLPKTPKYFIRFSFMSMLKRLYLFFCELYMNKNSNADNNTITDILRDTIPIRLSTSIILNIFINNKGIFSIIKSEIITQSLFICCAISILFLLLMHS